MTTQQRLLTILLLSTAMHNALAMNSKELSQKSKKNPTQDICKEIIKFDKHQNGSLSIEEENEFINRAFKMIPPSQVPRDFETWMNITEEKKILYLKQTNKQKLTTEDEVKLQKRKKEIKRLDKAIEILGKYS